MSFLRPEKRPNPTRSATPPARSVTILGFFQDRREAPLDTTEVWGSMYEAYDDLRWTRWFEMHQLDFLRRWRPNHVAWLAKQSRPIYMLEAYPEIPAAVAYPRQEVNAALGRRFGFSHDYFTSSFSYMLALALHEHFGAVGLYGVGLIEDGECLYERAGLEYLIGMAQGAGVKVTMGKGTPILRIDYVYGYTEPRLNLADVAPIISFLEQNAKFKKASADSIEAWLKAAPKDDPQAQYMARQMIAYDSQVLQLKDLATWLKHYGRGGCLIGPDGDLAK